MNARPRLLFLAQTLPYPPDGGVNIRTYNILKLLSTVFEIDLVCFYRAGIARDVELSRRALAGLVRSVAIFPISQEVSRIRFLEDHVRSIATHSVYTRFAYRNKACWAYLKSLLAERTPQLVHVDSLDLSGYLPLFDGIAVACTHHNIESALLDRRATAERNALRSAYIRHQASLMKREEQVYAPQLALNVVCSQFDQTTLAQIAPGARSIVVPNGVDTSAFSFAKTIQNGIVSVGGTTWYPNRDGLEYFSTDIQPQIQRRLKSCVTWVGRCRDSEVAKYAKRGITLTGYVDSVQPYVHGARCFVAPLRVGGGTRLKLVDAWAMGAAIVSTPIAAEGLNAVDGDNMLIRESPSDFAEAVCAVISDDSLRRKLELASRLTAEEYDWRKISKEMLQVYQSLADRAC